MKNSAPRKRVLVVDDDRGFAETLSEMVRSCGHEVVGVVTSGGLAAIQQFSQLRPDIVLLDVVMPKFNGFTVCQQMLSRKADARVLLMSGTVTDDYPSVSTCGAAHFLHKPISYERLELALGRCAARPHPQLVAA